MFLTKMYYNNKKKLSCDSFPGNTDVPARVRPEFGVGGGVQLRPNAGRPPPAELGPNFANRTQAELCKPKFKKINLSN